MVDGSCTTSFKTCLNLGQLMRITDVRWPAVREIARYILRSEHVVIRGPGWLAETVHKLALDLAEMQPSRTSFPSHELDEDDSRITVYSTNDESIVALCGLNEPPLNAVWLPATVHFGWQAIMTVAEDLLQAGYPGCLGCGGPNTELEWNEKENRLAMKNSASRDA